MSAAIDYLRSEVAKRLAPWAGKDHAGQPVMKPPLCTAIVIMPSDAIELLRLLEERHGNEDP